MAEFVQQSIEDMLPEMEQLERVQLFSKDETRTILKKRKGFEYKLRRKTKEKEDFMQYVQYEINVLGLIRKRREKTGYYFKRVEIDVAIVQRIHKLFELTLQRFREDVEVWLSYIEFCKLRKEKSNVSRLFNRMLGVHPRKPELWILAAKWEMEEIMSSENTRNFLQRGLRFNPDSKRLWLESYRMELLHADKLRKRQEILGTLRKEEGASDAVLEGRVAMIVFKKAVEQFEDDVNAWLSFLPISRLFDFTTGHQEEILALAQKYHSDKEVTWDAVARQHLPTHSKIRNKDVRHCCNVYEAAVTKLNTECMWDLYLSCLLELTMKEGLSEKSANKRVESFTATCECAAEKGLLSEKLATQWIEVLMQTGQVERISGACERATMLHPGCVGLWCLRLQHAALPANTSHNLLTLFAQARQHVQDKVSLPLWQLAISWCLACKSDRTEELFQVGCQCGAEVAVPLKVQYLEWAAITGGIHKARHVYNSLKCHKPVSVELFTTAVAMESCPESAKIKRLRQIYEDALDHYGTTNTDLWLSYIRLELEHPQGQATNSSTLHWRAVKMLDGQLTELFITQYTLLQTGHLEH